MKTTWKWRQPQKWSWPKNWRRPQKLAHPSKTFPPRLHLKNYLKFFWWLLTVTATPQLMLNRKLFQDSKPEMEFHMINIIYAEFSIRAQTEKTTFSCKDDCTLTKHTGRWTFSAKDFKILLCHTPPLRSFFFWLAIASKCWPIRW